MESIQSTTRRYRDLREAPPLDIVLIRKRLSMAKKLTKIEKERLKCACFYVLLCVMIGLLIAWNFMSGDANVFVKMFDFNGN